MNAQENISSLTVEDLLGLLNCPQEEIVSEARNLIKDQFSNVTDKWLVIGLLDYFFSTNSKRILDLLMGAPEPHCKYLLEKISGGIRSGGDRFRYVSLLLYAVSRNPPPIWAHKIPNAIMKDLLDTLSPSRESDINVLVSGVMVLVLLLPSLPLEFTKHLLKIFECFWRLVHWTPNREQDIALKPYLQVAVYSLFHRLYALYPCNLLAYLRVHMVGQAKKSWFLSTLRPMLERVRLHPLLVSETKETEVSKSRWVGLEPSDLIHECAKLCLDPLQEICEEMYFNNSSNRQSICESVADTSDYIILCSSENNFWSPGAVQSPSTINTSVPHTPVYAFQLLGNQSTGIAESPPEAAVEATPETTPFPSPSPFVAPKHDCRTVPQRLPKLKTSMSETSQESRPPPSPLSPIKKEGLPFKFPSKHGQDILLKSEKSYLLQNKLQEIERQRIVRQKEGDVLPPPSSDGSKSGDVGKTGSAQEEQQTGNEICKRITEESKTDTSNGDTKKEASRKRKVAVYAVKDFENLEIKSDSDLFSEENDIEKEAVESEKPQHIIENDRNAEVSRKDSDDFEAGNDEGLGLPCRQSMTELMRNVKTNRLRFLSQCGPPPNIPLLSELGTKRSVSPAKSSKPLFLRKHKSRSFPNLFCDSLCMLPATMPKRDYTVSSLSLSPVKPPVETFEEATQTEEAPIVDPYEQLLEVLMVPVHSRSKEIKENKEKDKPSPYQLLDQFIEYGCRNDPPPCQETGWNTLSGTLNDKAVNHLRSMQCLMMLERYKREVHAERNRRLLGRIKRLHLLQEKDLGLHKEKGAMKEEMLIMNQTLLKLQEKNNVLERKLNDMVEKRTLFEVQEKQSKASCQRDQLRKMCDSLQREKSALTRELENCRSDVRDCQRQLKIHLRHSTENTVLRSQVEDLNKRLLIMGETQLEMHQQMKNYKEYQRQIRSNALAKEKAVFAQKIEELEYKNMAEKTSLQAAMFRIGELEKKLSVQHMEKQNHRKEIESTVASWKERCDALEKRNKELSAINITLESQMTQLLRYRPEREAEEGAEARRLMAPTSRDGFPPPVNPQEFEAFPEVLPGSYIARMTSNEFRSISSPNPDE